MTRTYVTQSSFTAGEIDPRMLGRTDLRAYENGARRIRNAVVEVTGGVRRRPGLAHVGEAAGRGRLVAMEAGGGQSYLLVFTHFAVAIWRNTQRATLATPFSEATLARIAWVQRGDQLIVTHPEVPAQVIRRIADTSWTIADLRFTTTAEGLTRAPFANFTSYEVALQSSGANGDVLLIASAPVFTADHLGSTVQIGGIQVDLTNIQGSTQAIGLVRAGQDPLTTSPTRNWEELAFSEARGWPVAITFHQNRMVIAGSRDLPNGLWLSKSGRHFNFDLGEGLDDEAIVFQIGSSEQPGIRALASGRHLQVFTTAGEWIVTGTPLTPINIQVQQQSRIGSPFERHVPPRDVDGATLFAARNGREIREFLFTESELAYQAADLALLARHLVNEPVDQVFDPGRRLLFIVMADGTLATVALYRNADVAAWSLLTTEGSFLSAAVAGGETLLLVERPNGVFIERLDEAFQVDGGKHLTSATAKTTWSGLGHLEGATVAVIADDEVVGPVVVNGGSIVLDQQASDVVVGLPYRHEIEPMPAAPAVGRTSPLAPAYRPVRVTLRVFDTRALRIDTGDGLRDLPLAGPQPFSGDVSLRALGWRRGADQPPWRIEQDAPLACMVLSVTTEVKVND